MVVSWSNLSATQRDDVVGILRRAQASSDAHTTTSIDAAIERLLVRRRGVRASTKTTHRLTHHLSLGGTLAAKAIGEIVTAVVHEGTIAGAAPLLGVTVRTLHRWQSQYPELAVAIREAAL